MSDRTYDIDTCSHCGAQLECDRDWGGSYPFPGDCPRAMPCGALPPGVGGPVPVPGITTIRVAPVDPATDT